MKKFLFAFVFIFLAHLGCKKGPCACSPTDDVPFAFSLIIKDSTGDLLNPRKAQYFPKSQIQLFYKNTDGTSKQIYFDIRSPFDGNESPYYLLFSSHLSALAESTN